MYICTFSRYPRYILYPERLSILCFFLRLVQEVYRKDYLRLPTTAPILRSYRGLVSILSLRLEVEEFVMVGRKGVGGA